MIVKMKNIYYTHFVVDNQRTGSDIDYSLKVTSIDSKFYKSVCSDSNATLDKIDKQIEYPGVYMLSHSLLHHKYSL